MNSSTRKERAPNVTASMIDDIVKIIDAWTGAQLLWEDILDAIEARLHVRYTRQALAKHTKIQIAYNNKNDLLTAGAKVSHSTGDPRLDEAFRVIQTQKAEIERLKKGEVNFLEQFARWAYNAYLEGVDTRKLDRPIEKPDRDASERPSQARPRSRK